jgi:hypothetical protein
MAAWPDSARLTGDPCATATFTTAIRANLSAGLINFTDQVSHGYEATANEQLDVWGRASNSAPTS